MTPELHRKAAGIFERACELELPERAAYIESACGSDSSLRSYVEQLLQGDRNAPQAFLGKPAVLAAAPFFSGSNTPWLAGTRLGTYEIHCQIGAGGMGIVYEARDLRLNRRVAVKVLTSSIVADDDRIRRFQQEARAASLLNHPNIVSLYDAGQDQGIHYIATELIEGKTLRQLAAEGPVPLKQLLDIAAQTASALSAAHEAGIVHRDIKPENIMVRHDGFVKVLDFGLAKVDVSRTPDTQTKVGLIAGTVHYLSPEQALGRPLGPCSDLFSLGIVLYELSTGTRPFTGATDWAVLDAIVRHNPGPASQLRPEIDVELDALIQRLLEKESEFRFQTAADLRSSLKRLTRDSQSGLSPAPPQSAPHASPRRASRWTELALTTAAAIAIIGGAYWWPAPWRALSTSAADPVPRRFERLTSAPGEETFPNLSPDGSQFFYAGASRGKWDIYLQRTGGSTVVNLTIDSKADDTQPALSRDGMKIAFHSERDGGGLFVMEATGENPRRVSTQGYLPAWSPDGQLLIYSSSSFTDPSARGEPVSRLHILNPSSGADRELKTADAIQPNWSPHGHRIAYWGVAGGGRRELFTVEASPGSEGEPIRLTSDPGLNWSPVWSRDGESLYFLSDRGGLMNLWRIPIDEKSGLPRGEPSPFTMPTPRMGSFNFSSDGRTMVFSNSDRGSNLFSVPYRAKDRKTAGEPESAISGTHYISNFSFSPDQSQMVYDTVGAPDEDIWVMNRDGTGRRRLDANPAKDRGPVWSPTGKEIAFFSDRSGRYEVWVIHSDGSGLRQITETAGPGLQAPGWSRDGQRLYSSRENGIIQVFPAHQGLIRNPDPALPPAIAVKSLWARESPDNRILALGSLSSGPFTLFHRDRQTAETTPFRGERQSWLPDGSGILYPWRGRCLLYDLKSATEVVLFDVSPARINAVALAGNRIYFTRAVRDGDLWLGRLK